jgi:tetratricopeptide (TPR) repeat protein
MNRKERRAPGRPGGSIASPIAAWLAAAHNHQSAGRLVEAEQLCRQILAIDRDDAQALHLFGLIVHQQGRTEQAIDLIRSAIARNGRDPAFHHNLGNMLRSREPAAAMRCYRRALSLAPDSADTLYNLGNIYQEQGRLDDAVGCFERALRLRPDAIELHNNLGAVLQDLGRLDDAVGCYRRALALRPDSVETLDNLGGALRMQGRLDEAQECFAHALALRPNRVESLIGLGLVARDRGRLDDAAACYTRVLVARPGYPPALINLGVALVELARPAEAAAYHRRALAAAPGEPEIHTNLGIALEHQGRYDEALACYANALALNPDNANAHFQRAHALLINGRFDEGWQEYEWRFQVARYDRKFRQPRWSGEPLAGKTILVHAEQGLGDTLQFARYLPALAETARRVVLEAPKPLIRLLGSLSGVDDIVAAGETLPRFDCHAPLLSLPRTIGTTLASIPAPVPYLSAELERITAWWNRLGADGFRIGIAWQGNPKAPMDRLRSIPLRSFAPLTAFSGVRLISLQRNDGLDQLAGLPAGMQVEVLGPEFDAGPDAFLDTAAVMMRLDLVIACDTSVAHLAGALGRPVWLLLGANPDWRWLVDRRDTPWYPTMQLFRQSVPGDWPGVIDRVATALAGLVS